MEFFTVSKTPRPVRLSEETRRFADESLHSKYGRETWATPSVCLDGLPDDPSRTSLDLYDIAIRKIAEEAPVRIVDGELVSGAATLGVAITHNVPAMIGGHSICSSVSHLTVNFEKVLKIGINGFDREIDESLARHKGDEKKERFLKSAKSVVASFRIWHERYLAALKEKGMDENYDVLTRVPFEPAKSYREAVQSIWFTFAWLRVCGNWPGFGRLDKMLSPYLEHDLDAGILTLDEAREILAHFFIKGCEWVRGEECGSGDAQHYQNIVISGIDADGNDITCRATYLILDVIEELGIGDFPTSVRLNKKSDEKFIRRVAEVIRHGGGVIAIYNEDLILDAMTGFGYPLSEARNFANDGCWEVQVPGKTCFSYCPFDSLRILQHETLGGRTLTYPDFESLFAAYSRDLYAKVAEITDGINGRFADTSVPACDWEWKDGTPCTCVSIFEDGCIERGTSYFEGGAVYNVVSPHIGGLPDTANELYAIKKLVFDDKLVTFEELNKILLNNWEGAEELRAYVRSHYRFYGNDNDEVDMIAARIIDEFAAHAAECGKRTKVFLPCGVSTFGRQIEWAPGRTASAHGFRYGDVLAGNFSPTPGTDFEGTTAIIRSYCKADLKKMVTGAALDVSLLPSSVAGETGLEALVGLIRGFLSLGGFFGQIDVADPEILRAAQEDPEKYATLQVRVSGWNARFVTLNREWQNMVIERDSK